MGEFRIPMKFLYRFWPLVLFFVLTAVFFGKTLTGQELFVTPDFALSDLLHGEYPTKWFVSDALKHGQLPLWNPFIAGGFPQMAMPTGIFFPINVFLYLLLPMPMAHYWVYATIVLTAACGTYIFARLHGVSKAASALAGISFAFSGMMVAQMVHLAVIQTLSLFPWELALCEFALQRKKRSVMVLLAFIIGMQLLVGFYQIVLYSLFFLVLYASVRVFIETGSSGKKLTTMFVFCGAIVLGFGIGAVQLIPSIEFTRISNRAAGIVQGAVWLFPYPLIHFITFLWPYLLGDPRIGTYRPFSDDWGLFWENTGFIGLIPLLLAGWAVIALVNRRRTVQLFSFLTLLAFLLMLGRNSPLFFVFTFPPFSLFRVPARFIMYVVFFLAVLAGFGLDECVAWLKKFQDARKLQQGTILLTLVLTIVHLFAFGYTYHLRGDTKRWLADPPTAQFLKKDESLYRIYTLGNGMKWNNVFLYKGWQFDSDKYLDLMASLDPNWNVLFGIEHADLYAILLTQKNQDLRMLVGQGTRFDSGKFTIDDTARTLLDLQNVKYVVSPFPVEGRDMQPVFTSKTNPPYQVYENTTVLPRAFAVGAYTVARTVGKQQEVVSGASFDPKTTVLTDKNLRQTFAQGTRDVRITRYENTYVTLAATFSEDGIAVLADAYYPGWKAIVDGKDAEILAVNINQRGVVVPKGEHTIRFFYEPESMRWGIGVSLLSVSIGVVIFVFLRKKEKRSSV